MKIYTSYFANYRNFPIGSLMVGITCFPPNSSMINVRELAPSADLLRDYKNHTIDEYMFKMRYLNELRERDITPEKVKNILNVIATEEQCNGDIILCCYEKPNEFCHRHILAEWLGDGEITEL